MIVLLIVGVVGAVVLLYLADRIIKARARVRHLREMSNRLAAVTERVEKQQEQRQAAVKASAELTSVMPAINRPPLTLPGVPPPGAARPKPGPERTGPAERGPGRFGRRPGRTGERASHGSAGAASHGAGSHSTGSHPSTGDHGAGNHGAGSCGTGAAGQPAAPADRPVAHPERAGDPAPRAAHPTGPRPAAS